MVYDDFGTIETQEYLMMRINEMRAFYVLPPFETDPAYTCAARGWSKRMWRLNLCTHRDPETRENFWDRIVLCEGRVYRVAELIACGQKNIEQALADWLNNPNHRQFLFSPGRKAGIGVAGDDDQDARWYTLIMEY